jgi:D-alanine-D-alanine ligase
MHKVTAKTLLACHGIPVPDGIVVRKGEAAGKPARLKWPVVVKPAAEGSTIGISIVRKPSEWRGALRRAHAYDREAIVEAYIPGHEVTVSVLRGARRAAALPTVEIVSPGGFYDYAAKYTKGRSRYLCPAPLPASVNRRVTALAVRAYEILGCDGAARVDFRVTPGGRPYLLEVNTIPGMTETSLLPMAAAKAGMDYDTLTEEILTSALRRAKAARC